MLSSTYQVERTAAAGCPRAIAAWISPSAGHGAAFVTTRVWMDNPSDAGVKAAQRHALTPAPRPEEAVPQ